MQQQLERKRAYHQSQQYLNTTIKKNDSLLNKAKRQQAAVSPSNQANAKSIAGGKKGGLNGAANEVQDPK